MTALFPRDWAVLYQAMEQAEAVGDTVLARQLREALIEARLSLRRQGAETIPSVADLALLDRLAADLLHRDLPEEALLVYMAAEEYSQRRGDRYAELLFLVRGVHPCITLLDLRAAGSALARVLGAAGADGLPDAASAIQAARNLQSGGASEPALGSLRAEVLYALGRYYAAVGSLGSAEQALVEALQLQEQTASPALSAAELALFLGEVRIDRGDFAGCAALYEREWPVNAEGSMRARWRLMHGAVLRLSGRLSEAAEVFRAALHDPEAGRSRRHAAWQLAQVLGVLNRISEAEELLEEAERLGGLQGADRTTLAALLAARREGNETDLQGPPSARELLSRAVQQADPVLSVEPDAVPAPTGSDAEVYPQRKQERVHDEWARLANLILLDLHAADAAALSQALKRFAWLAEWSEGLDSQLLAAKLQYLWALVTYAAADYGAAGQHAEDACRRFATLHMPMDEGAATRVLRWTCQRRPAATDRVDALVAHEQHLQQHINQHLSAEDRVFYAMNKWSVLEEVLSQRCHALRRKLAQPIAAGLSGWRERQRRQRLVRDTLQAIVSGRRWDKLDRSAANGAPPAELSPAGVNQRVELQVRLAQATGRRQAEERVMPGWLGRGDALLYYVSFPDRVELFVVTRAGCKLQSLPRVTSRIELRELSRQALKKELDYADVWIETARPLSPKKSLGALAERLGLTAVVAELPSAVRHLIVVPDDVLFHVPFAALPVGGRPLVERFAVSLLPYLRWLPRPPAARRRHGITVAMSRTRHGDGAYHDLTNAKAESDAAIQLCAGPGMRVLRDGQAQRHLVLAELSRAQVAHFACHGEFFPERPHDSGLVLADAILRVADLRTQRLEALDVVMLSSCWLANVSVLPGRELVGVPMAFLEQGASMVITSLWKVLDEVSLKISREIFTALRTQPHIYALAYVQRQLLSTMRPRDWSSFVVYLGGLVLPWSARWLLRFRS